MSSMTEAELLQQVQNALHTSLTKDNAMSVAELSEALDMSESAVRKRLKKMIAENLAETIKVSRIGMDGIVSRRIAYRLINKKEEGERK
jgi:predicted ArsR family transcriptional regulator